MNARIFWRLYWSQLLAVVFVVFVELLPWLLGAPPLPAGAQAALALLVATATGQGITRTRSLLAAMEYSQTKQVPLEPVVHQLTSPRPEDNE